MSAVAFMTTNVMAYEKITGAFGIKFGQTFDILSPRLEYDSLLGSTNNHGKTNHWFNPKNKYQGLGDRSYFFNITPKTHKVFSIRAAKGNLNELSCKRKQDMIMSILGKKYGKVKVKPIYQGSFQTINQPHAQI